MSDEDTPKPYSYRNSAIFFKVDRLLGWDYSPRACAIRRIALGTSCPLCGRILVQYPSPTNGDPVLRCSRKEHAHRDPYAFFDIGEVR